MWILHGVWILISCIGFDFELVAAINSLYAALGSPVLPGWVGTGGDPCGESWQGVQCNASDIITMYGNAFVWFFVFGFLGDLIY